MYFVCEFGLLLVELEKWPLRNEVALGLGYWLMSWPVKAYFVTYDHWKSQQARNFRGRSEWLNMKKSGGRNKTLSKILAISQHAMQSGCRKLRQGQDALEQKAVSRPGKRERTKTCSAIMSPFWLIFLSFFRLWPFQSGKTKTLEMLRIKKILFAVVFIAMWQGKWIFLYEICSNFCHLATVDKDWCAWQLSGTIFWLLSWGHINGTTGTRCKGLKYNKGQNNVIRATTCDGDRSQR